MPQTEITISVVSLWSMYKSKGEVRAFLRQAMFGDNRSTTFKYW